MEEKRGRGQPPKGDDARTETVRTRFTKAEREAIERAAERRGLSLSEYVRGVLNRAARR